MLTNFPLAINMINEHVQFKKIYIKQPVVLHHLQFSSSSAIINFQFSDDTIDTDAATSTTTADANVTWMCPICGLC